MASVYTLASIGTAINASNYPCYSDEELRLALVSILCRMINSCEECSVATILSQVYDASCINERRFLELLLALLCYFGEIYYTCPTLCDDLTNDLGPLRCLTEDQVRLSILGLLILLVANILNGRA